MAWVKIPVQEQWTNANDVNAAGFVIKCYLPGTTTVTPMAIDKNGVTTVTTATLNADGFPEVSGNEVALYIDRDFKIAIYQNASDAAANTNAYWGPVDNVKINSLLSDFQVGYWLADYTALRAINPGNYSADDVITVTNSGIAGEGVLRNVTSHGLTDNGGTIIVINSNWYWERIYSGHLNVKWFGAVGDNSTDNSTALQDALDATPNGGRLFVPYGSYVYTTGLTRTTPIYLEGEGTHGSTGSVWKYTGSGTALDMTTSHNGTRISNLRIEGTSSATRGLAFRNCFNNITLDQVAVEGFTGASVAALYLSDVFDLTILGGYYRQSNIGIQGAFVGQTVNAIRIFGADITNNSNVGIDIRAGQNWTIVGVDLSGIPTNGIGIDIANQMGTSGNPVAKSINVISCYLQSQDAVNETGIRIGNNASASSSAIANNNFYGNFMDVSGGDHFYVDVAQDTRIEANHHGAVAGGKYKANITASAVRTYLDIRPRSGINDLGSLTYYHTTDIQTLTEVNRNYTSPNKSQFMARPTSTITNVTGNGTVYTLICATELKDAASEYNTSTGRFTAEKTGQYQISLSLTLSGMAGVTQMQVRLVTSNRNHDLFLGVPNTTGAGSFTDTWSTLADLDAADQAYITIEATGAGADSVDVLTSTQFSGFLI